MKHPILTLALGAAFALAAASSSYAQETKAQPPTPAASQAKAAKKAAKTTRAAAAAPAAAKLVNINGANAEELKTLPGVTDAMAAKIIAGRPYGSKAQLVSRKIMGEAEFQNLRQLVVAKQPYKSAAKNAALQATKKP